MKPKVIRPRKIEADLLEEAADWENPEDVENEDDIPIDIGLKSELDYNDIMSIISKRASGELLADYPITGEEVNTLNSVLNWINSRKDLKTEFDNWKKQLKLSSGGLRASKMEPEPTEFPEEEYTEPKEATSGDAVEILSALADTLIKKFSEMNERLENIEKKLEAL
jgi:hypothetical protein